VAEACGRAVPTSAVAEETRRGRAAESWRSATDDDRSTNERRPTTDTSKP